MTQQPDDRQPEEPAQGTPDAEPARGLDEDAAWAEIVANYGERPSMYADPPAGPRPSVFDRSYLEAQRLVTPQGELEEPDAGQEAWKDEGHFVPPTPPPLPVVEPRRRLAWAGLFGAPLLMLVGVVLGWDLPAWLGAVLVAAFVGGFVYLVATMTRARGDWPGDDGAVV